MNNEGKKMSLPFKSHPDADLTVLSWIRRDSSKSVMAKLPCEFFSQLVLHERGIATLK